jgi:hypothetical protein
MLLLLLLFDFLNSTGRESGVDWPQSRRRKMKSGGTWFVCAFLFVTANISAQEWDWVQRFSSDSSGTAIGVDGNQNVYVAGTFTGTNYLGTNQFVSAGGNDIFLLKLNPDGEVVWAISTGGPVSDSIHRLVVGTNGALFVIGNFTINAALLADSLTNRSGDVSNVFVARVDDGKFTWFDTLPPDAGLGSVLGFGIFNFQSIVAGVGGVAFGPDGLLWVIASSNAVFVHKYAEDGTLVGGYAIDAPWFAPNGISISADEHVFVSGRLVDQTYFTAALGTNGQIQWSWNAGYDGYFHEYNPIYNIAATPDSGVVSLAAVHSGFNWVGVIVKHSADGTRVWGQNRAIYYKSVFSPRALAVDLQGNIHITGRRIGHYLYPQRSDGIWLLSLDANGNQISEGSISSQRFSGPWSLGTGISITSDGAIYITGFLQGGTAFFGTNFVSPATGNAFIARRSTLQPELTTEQIGGSAIFSWPRAASPFALQQSDPTGTNWSFITEMPERVGVRWQITLPADQATGMFRLLQTNEAPIRYPPRVQWTGVPQDSRYLEHKSAVVLPPGTNALSRNFSAYVSADGPGSRVTFETLDAVTGEPLSPARSFSVEPYIPTYGYVIVCYCTGISSVTSSFPPGQYWIALRVSDGVDQFTNSTAFEVITFDAALQELRAALESLTSNQVGRHLVAFFESALRTGEQGREKLSENRWRHFQRQLQRITSLSEEERGKLSSAATQIQSLAQTK